MNPEKQFKIVLLGEGCVGKTSIVSRYCLNTFNASHNVTVQASYLTKKIQLPDNTVKLCIWDTAGQEKFHALGPIYYRDANGALLVYDITDKDTFEMVQTWVKELKQIVGDDIVLAIAGNKCDLERNRAVTLEDAESYAKSVGATHFQTSAKLGKGLEELFLDMTKKMLQSSKSSSGPQLGKKGVIFDDGSSNSKSTSDEKCC